MKRKSPQTFFTKCPTKAYSGLWLGRASGKELLAVKNKKVEKLHFFGHKLRFLVNIPRLELKTPLLTLSYICYTEVHAKIQRDPTGGFRNRFPDGSFFNDKILITWAAERVPPRAAKSAGKQPRPPSWGLRVSLEWIRHTSSKGMPRHAHRRWALVWMCGVD